MQLLKTILMKSLEPENPTPEKPEIFANAEMRKALKLMGPLRVQPGHTLFEFNLKTREIKPAEFETTLDIKGENATKRLILKVNCVYKYFLNRKNAEKKFIQFAKYLASS